jgi:hypothetical protein
MYWMLANLSLFAQTSFREAVENGLKFQVQADSILRLSEAGAAELAVAFESDKIRIRNTIREYYAQAATYQTMANEQFNHAASFKEVTMQEIAVYRESEFDILSQSPYSTNNPVPLDQPLPDGVAYKIQLGAYGRPLQANTFKGLTPISGEKMENGVTKYYVGLFRLYSDAYEALHKVREYGFKDAYIVAFYNKKPVNNERAKQLENI